jgi:hypothetical protein
MPSNRVVDVSGPDKLCMKGHPEIPCSVDQLYILPEDVDWPLLAFGFVWWS